MLLVNLMFLLYKKNIYIFFTVVQLLLHFLRRRRNYLQNNNHQKYCLYPKGYIHNKIGNTPILHTYRLNYETFKKIKYFNVLVY